MDLYPSETQLAVKPVALVGKHVCIQYASTEHFRRVISWEPIPHFQFLNIGAIAAATTSARTAATNLQANDNEFLQIRWYCLDTAQVRCFVPNATAKNNLKNLQVAVDPTAPLRDPDLHLNEIYIWEDNNPAFEAINYTAVQLAACRLIGFGFRFVTDALPASKIEAIKNGAPCTYLPATGTAGNP